MEEDKSDRVEEEELSAVEKSEDKEEVSSLEPELAESFVEVDQGEELTPVKSSDFIVLREELVKKYHKTSESLFDKIQNRPDGSNVEIIINTVLEELIKETDNLLGNELTLMQSGHIRDSSVVSVKRSDVLSIVSRVAARKHELSTLNGSVDLNAPAFQLFQQLCFDKLVVVLDKLNVDPELKQLVALKWGEEMENWDKEMKYKLGTIK